MTNPAERMGSQNQTFALWLQIMNKENVSSMKNFICSWQLSFKSPL